MSNNSAHTALCTRILEKLNRPGSFAFKVFGGPGSETGIPDIIACVGGRFFGIEVKTGTGKVSPKQRYQLERIINAGGEGIVARSVEDVDLLLAALPLVNRAARRVADITDAE